jgi:hypothetical protein
LLEITGRTPATWARKVPEKRVSAQGTARLKIDLNLVLAIALF